MHKWIRTLALTFAALAATMGCPPLDELDQFAAYSDCHSDYCKLSVAVSGRRVLFSAQPADDILSAIDNSGRLTEAGDEALTEALGDRGADITEPSCSEYQAMATLAVGLAVGMNEWSCDIGSPVEAFAGWIDIAEALMRTMEGCESGDYRGGRCR
jgi:hypothetical protein